MVMVVVGGGGLKEWSVIVPRHNTELNRIRKEAELERRSRRVVLHSFHESYDVGTVPVRTAGQGGKEGGGGSEKGLGNYMTNIIRGWTMQPRHCSMTFYVILTIRGVWHEKLS